MAKRQTAIRLDVEQLAAIGVLAKRERRSVAAMIRILLDEALERRGHGGGVA